MFLKTEIFFLRFQKYPDTCGSHGHKQNRLVFTKYSKLCAFQITAPTLAIEQQPIKFCEGCSLRGKCLKVMGVRKNGAREGGGGGEKELPLPSHVFLTRPVLPAFTKGAISSESFTGDFAMRETMAVNCFRTVRALLVKGTIEK